MLFHPVEGYKEKRNSEENYSIEIKVQKSWSRNSRMYAKSCAPNKLERYMSFTTSCREWTLNTTQRTHTCLRRLQDVLKRSRRLTTKPYVLTTSGRRRLIYDVLKTPDLCRLKDVRFTTSWRSLICDVLKTSDSRRLRDVRLRRLDDVLFTMSWRRLIYDVLKTSNLLHLEDLGFTSCWRGLIYDVLRTSVLRWLEDVWFATSWRRL